MRILLVTGGAPWPPVSGVNQRTNLLATALQALGRLDLLVVSPWVTLAAEEEAVLRARFGFRGLCRPGARPAFRLLTRAAANHDLSHLRPDPGVAAAVRGLLAAERHDLVVFRYLRSAALADAARLPLPWVLDADDLDPQMFEARIRAARGLLRLRRRAGLALVRRLARPLLARAAHVWVASAADLPHLAPFRGAAPASVLPNVPFAAPEAPAGDPGGPGRACMIVASCRHRPNVEGIARFLAGPWREVRARCPDAVLRIAGHGMTAAQRAEWGAVPGVEPLGEVADLAALYAASDLALVPVTEGGGTKIKLVEAFAHGRAAVATVHAARGLEALVAAGLRPAADGAAFAAETVALLTDPARRAGLARAGRAALAETHSPAGFRARVAADLRPLLPGAPARPQALAPSTS